MGKKAKKLLFPLHPRLRVVSNFGDRDCGAGEILTRVHVKFRGDALQGERQKLETTDLPGSLN